MNNLFKVLMPCLLTFFFSEDCLDRVEVKLWGECYNIKNTIKLNLSGSGLTGKIPSQIGALKNLYSID